MISTDPALPVSSPLAADDSQPRSQATGPGLERALWVAVAILVAAYVVLFVAGVRFFVFKTVLLPLILAYGLVVRQRVAFAADWLPLVSATLLFDAVRGAIFTMIDRGYHTFYVRYVIDLEEALFGVPAVPIPVQELVRTPALDVAAVLLHASHFLFFLMFGLVLWQVRREHFRTFRRVLVLVMLFGLVGYAVIPTAPPWIAANFGQIPPLAYVSREVYTLYAQELYGTFATNPVAAMPSLHVAFPTACAIVGWRAYGRRIGAVLAAYASAVSFAVMYLGEHYGVDVIAGVAVAALAAEAGRRVQPIGLSARAMVVISVAGLLLTYVIVGVSRAVPAMVF